MAITFFDQKIAHFPQSQGEYQSEYIKTFWYIRFG